jgi:hypothetical protein
LNLSWGESYPTCPPLGRGEACQYVKGLMGTGQDLGTNSTTARQAPKHPCQAPALCTLVLCQGRCALQLCPPGEVPSPGAPRHVRCMPHHYLLESKPQKPEVNPNNQQAMRFPMFPCCCWSCQTPLVPILTNPFAPHQSCTCGSHAPNCCS